MMIHRLTPALCLAVMLLTGYPAAAHDGKQHAPQSRATVSSMGAEKLMLPDLRVTSATGESGGFRSLLPERAPIILSFTYTGCESLCDITNAILLQVDVELIEAGQADARIVTLSIDPENDTPEHLDAARRELGSSDRWLWLTGGVRGTRPLLDALRFPAGAIEQHDPIFLVGRRCSGQFTRVIGLVDPGRIVALAQGLPECTG
jgi:protein SCO1/2